MRGRAEHVLDQARAETDRLRQELNGGKPAAQPSRKAGGRTGWRTYQARRRPELPGTVHGFQGSACRMRCSSFSWRAASVLRRSARACRAGRDLSAEGADGGDDSCSRRDGTGYGGGPGERAAHGGTACRKAPQVTERAAREGESRICRRRRGSKWESRPDSVAGPDPLSGQAARRGRTGRQASRVRPTVIMCSDLGTYELCVVPAAGRQHRVVAVLMAVRPAAAGGLRSFAEVRTLAARRKICGGADL